mgnify:CR=1 FL=1
MNMSRWWANCPANLPEWALRRVPRSLNLEEANRGLRCIFKVRGGPCDTLQGPVLAGTLLNWET